MIFVMGTRENREKRRERNSELHTFPLSMVDHRDLDQ